MAEKTKRRNADRTQPGFDLEAAKKMAASFSGACDVRCRVWHLDGTVLYETGRAEIGRASCRERV